MLGAVIWLLVVISILVAFNFLVRCVMQCKKHNIRSTCYRYHSRNLHRHLTKQGKQTTANKYINL